MTRLSRCPVCERPFQSSEEFSSHFLAEAGRSDAGHVMWLNRNVTKQKENAAELSGRLRGYFDIEGMGLKGWIKTRFIERFFGERPHPFVLALQHPSKGVLLGYVLEHQHFLKQWVRSLSWVLAKADSDEVVKEELDNIVTEFYGYGDDRPSHYELLLRMGESLGMDRRTILSTPPLPDTTRAIAAWQEIGEKRHWLETMVAMHSLELIANRNVKKDGARIAYFDPSILTSGEITRPATAFLMEGYEADVEHSEVPLEMVEKYATDGQLIENIQVTFLKSMEAFDAYLMARLERAMQFDSSLVRYVSEVPYQ